MKGQTVPSSLILAMVHALALGQDNYVYPSVCSEVFPQQDVDYDQMSGPWNDIIHSTNVHFMCGIYTHNILSKPRYNTTFTGKDKDGASLNYHVEIYLEKLEYPNGMFLNVHDGYIDRFAMFILETDYDNYIFYYSCEFMKGGKYETLHVSSRTKTIDPAIVERVVKKNKLEHLELEDGWVGC